MTEPRWLSEREQGVWRRYLEVTRFVQDETDRQLQRDAGLPHAYYEVLVQLSEAPGRTLRMSELADRCSSSRSRLSHAVARMESSGWIERQDCPSDKRGQLAVLTEQGFGVLAMAAADHVETVRRALFDPLSADQVDALGEVCETILRARRGSPDGDPCEPST
jgi:DNA-binding MarR family transcriptional regulator